jgi:hypothetical protein
MADVAEAKIVVLRSTQPFANQFHRQITPSQALGQVIHKGERLLVYEVIQTFPDQAVLITDQTFFEFC